MSEGKRLEKENTKILCLSIVGDNPFLKLDQLKWKSNEFDEQLRGINKATKTAEESILQILKDDDLKKVLNILNLLKKSQTQNTHCIEEFYEYNKNLLNNINKRRIF